jgi:hypothetical protein
MTITAILFSIVLMIPLKLSQALIINPLLGKFDYLPKFQNDILLIYSYFI